MNEGPLVTIAFKDLYGGFVSGEGWEHPRCSADGELTDVVVTVSTAVGF